VGWAILGQAHLDEPRPMGRAHRAMGMGKGAMAMAMPMARPMTTPMAMPVPMAMCM